MTLLAQVTRTSTEQRFELADLPRGWEAVIVLGVVVVLCWSIVWMYRREGRRGASTALRTGLAIIRCTVVLALAAVWTQPVLATYLHRWIDSYCLVLIDDSSSMDLQDRYRFEGDADRVRSVMGEDVAFPVRRADLLTTLIQNDRAGMLERLSQRNRVKVYRFSDSPELVATIGGDHPTEAEPIDTPTASDEDVSFQFTAQGPATNVSRALRRSLESLGGAPLAGVVLLSDGGFNQGDPVEVLAKTMEEQHVPLHVVGIGDSAEPQNVRVTEVIAPENAFRDDPFSITAHITTQGFAGETITVELYERTSSDAASGPPVETKILAVGSDGSVPPVVFERSRDSVGRGVYRVSVPVGPHESVADDNSKQTVINVIDDKMRVLLIAGSPSWEYRYVSRLLTRDGTFDVSCWLQSAALNAVRDGNTIIDHLPATAEELFEYDAVVLIDPDPAEFGPGWAKQVESLVMNHGGGLLFVASRKFTPQFLRDSAVRRIVQLLPITPDPEADLILNRIGHYQTRDWPFEIPPEAFNHPILRAGADVSVARERWREALGVFWHFPVLREKPVASVLLRHGNPQMRNAYGQHILLATQFAGSGRTAFMAFDGTWRWRRTGDQLFNGYWVQMLRYLVEGKLLGVKKRVTVLTEGDTFQLGTSVSVSARLLDSQFEPMQVDSVQASFTHAARQRTFNLSRIADRAGWYEGRFTPDRTGAFQINLTLPGAGAGDDVSATHDVQIVRPNIEVLDPRMNREALLTLVQHASQGGYYEIDEVDRLINAIPDRHETRTVKRPPVQLWDRWWTLAILIGLLSVEWAIRKWVRLL